MSSEAAVATGVANERVALQGTFADVLRRRAAFQRESVAFRFLGNGDDESCAMTYGELEAEVVALAGRLQNAGLAGERVLLLYPAGPEYLVAMLACLYAGVVAVPLYPPRQGRECPRLDAVAQNARPRAALATAAVVESHGSKLSELARRYRFRAMTRDELDEHGQSSWTPRPAGEQPIAYLQYTSGATRKPKGVAITHRNLFHNCAAIASVVGTERSHTVVSWLPFFHDMGLVGAIFLPMFIAAPLVFMPPEAFVMRPARWLQAITNYRATLSPAPNFAYDLCVRRVAPKLRGELDLSCWHVAFNGSERVDAASLDAFAAAFSECGFRRETFFPCYGLAEATLLVSGGPLSGPPVVERFARDSLACGRAVPDEAGLPLVGCGCARGDLEVAIVDPTTRKKLPTGRVGEIWVSGPSIAAGYWNPRDQTVEPFDAGTEQQASCARLRTGDCGFLHDGQLFISGRVKDLIIVGGRNIYPEDLEATAEAAHQAVCPQGAVAFSIEDGPQEQIVLLVEVDLRSRPPPSSTEVERAIRDAIAQVDNIAIDRLVLVRRRSLPKTPSGKKQRAGCRDAFLGNAVEPLKSLEPL